MALRTWSFLHAWWAGWLALAACGDAGGSSADGTTSASEADPTVSGTSGTSLEPTTGDGVDADAAEVCGVWLGCCATQYSTSELCEQMVKDLHEQLSYQQQTYGLVYDPACLKQQLLEQADGCPGGAPRPACGRCLLLHGDNAVGEACDQDKYGSAECMQGLECRLGVCTDTCPPRGVDEVCADGGDIFVACAEGLVCDVGGSKTCVPLVAIGEGCKSKVPCVPGAYCESGMMVCAAQGGVDAACAGDEACGDGLTCDAVAMKCRPVPQAGEACEQVCAAGFYCGMGTCVAEQPEGAACAANEACSGDLACVEQVCSAELPGICVGA